MSNNLEHLLEFLNQQAELNDKINKKSINPSKNIQRLILENGLPFLERIAPSPFNGVPKSCYQNCFQALWKYPELNYCEGFAISDDVPIAISHAWLVDAKSQVIDPTWSNDAPGCTYFGAVFTEDFVREIALKTKCYGILDNYRVDRHQILQDGFPKGALHPKFHSNRMSHDKRKSFPKPL